MDIKDTQRCHSNKTRLGINETKYRCGFNITSCFHLSQSVSTIENFTSWMESLPQTADSDSDHSQTKRSRAIPRECECVCLCECVSVCECVARDGCLIRLQMISTPQPMSIDTISAVIDTPIPVSVARGKTPPHHHFLVAMPVPAWL